MNVFALCLLEPKELHQPFWRVFVLVQWNLTTDVSVLAMQMVILFI